MRHVTVLLTITCALLAAAVPVAHADSLLVDAPGARNLAGGGGYLAWSAPAAGRWQLTIRRPDGTVFVPKIATFSRPAQPSLGSSGPIGPNRPLVAVYARGGDVFELELKSGTERRLSRLSTSANETLAAINLGQYVVARQGRGLYSVSREGRTRRLTRSVPSSVAMAQSRVASIEGSGSSRRVVVRRLSGKGRALVVGDRVTRAGSLWLTRYRAGYATSRPTQLYATRRFAGSGGPFTLSVVRDDWTSDSALYGIAVADGEPAYYLDADGVKRFAPRPFHGA